MAIKRTELVTLNGDVNAFGGRIYNASYQVGFSQSPSSIKLSIVNESGSYNIDEDDLDIDGSPDTITFGVRSVKMYPIEYSIDEGSGGKILTVEYQDASIIYLDKKFVVLKGTHIESKSNSPTNPLITVGEKYYSQEIEDESGNIIITQTIDPPNVIDLGQSMYFVSELFDVMVSIGIPMHESVGNILLNKDGATDYLNDIVGTLRSVLSAWGGRMAFSFYWGEDNKLHLVDLEQGIAAKTEKLKNIIPFSNEESHSLKGTISRGYALYYGKEGNFSREEQPPHKASFFFRRKRNFADFSANDQSLIKAALLGESFWTGAALWGVFNTGNDSGPLGISGIVKLTNEEKAYVDSDDTYSDLNFIKYKQGNTTRTYGSYRGFLEEILTYEKTISEKDFEKYSSWSHSFDYDNDNELASLHIALEEGFDISSIGNIPADPIVAVDFSNTSQAKGEGLDPAEFRVAGYELGVDYAQIISSISYTFDKAKLTVRGYKPRPAGSFIFPRIEKISTTKPIPKGVLSIDMQLDSTDDNEVALAENFEAIAEILDESYTQDKKSFRKSFSVTGIDLPQKIEIEDGLQSMSISNTNDKGTTTTYTVGNTFFVLPSKDIILQKLSREKFAQLKANPVGGAFIFNRGGFNV